MPESLEQKATTIGRMLSNLNLTLAPLEADLGFAGQQWAKDKGNQFWRRTMIRCFLAYTEALLWNMRAIVPNAMDLIGVQLSTAEREVIEERRKAVVDGVQVTKSKFLPFRDSFKATFTLFAKGFGVAFAVNTGKEFDALCATYELRSRLMHPKKPFDPDVSDDAIKKTQVAVSWFVGEYQRLMAACKRKIETSITSQGGG